MASRSRPRRRPRGSIPLWVFLLLGALLAGALLLRLAVRSPRPPEVNSPRDMSSTDPSGGRSSGSREARPFPRRKAPSGTEAPAPPRIGTGGQAVLAIVIDDVGQSLDLAETATRRLPPPVTFAVIPFLPASESSARLLHVRGFPVILHAPMEPLGPRRWRATPGTLMTGMATSEAERILLRDIEAVPHAEGVNNHMGSRATQDADLMRAVMGVLKERDLYFLDSRTSPLTVAHQAAREAGVPSASRAVFLDGEDDVGAIMAQLDTLVARSRKEGALVGIGHLRPNTVEALARRMPYWSSRSVRFVPLREVVR